jgi:ABC-type cobalamin/Fe3+-siderophores transport system ATPase subunit
VAGKKARRNRAAALAPPKNTGGGGFTFENDAAAYLMANMLAGRQPFGARVGTITRVALQCRSDGWLLDDVVLTCNDGVVEHRIALSVKDRPALDELDLLGEFVRLCWLQFLGCETSAMDVTRDLLGLVTLPGYSEAAREIDELLQLALKDSGRQLVTRIQTPRFTSETRRNLWRRFTCPSDLAAAYDVSEERTQELLRSVRILQLDLNRTISDGTQLAIAICRDVLESASVTEAEALWDALRGLAADARPRAGSFTFEDLLLALAGRFQLRPAPDMRRDWDTIVRRSAIELTAIPSTVGNGLTISRASLSTELANKVDNHRANVILGASGSGKTVLAKSYAQAKAQTAAVVWIAAGSLEDHDLASLERRWGLSRPFSELFVAPPKGCAYLFLDGVERLSQRGLGNLRTLLLASQPRTTSPFWNVVLTCQPEDWIRIHSSLLGAGLPVDWQVIVVPPLSSEELALALAEFPQLSHLELQRHLRPLLRNPKVLDVVVRGMIAGGSTDFSGWVGESDLIDWFWKIIVDQPPNAAQRSGFLQRLAELQADAVAVETPLAELSAGDLGPLDALVHDGLCRRIDERVRFSHDLYGDWARQRLLIGRGLQLAGYIMPRAASPLWNRAIRLYGLHLLEHFNNPSAWEGVLRSVAPDTETPEVVQDLLLEAVITSANAEALLEKTWPALSKHDGRLLRRLLGRFMYVATLPNPMVVALAKTLGEDLETFAATQARLPYWPYWLPMLRFLHHRKDDLLTLAPRHIAEICETWLRRGLGDWPLRLEAAELAVALAEGAREYKRSGGYYSGEDRVDAVIFRAALAAAKELPARVKAFAYEAAGVAPSPREGTPQ